MLEQGYYIFLMAVVVLAAESFHQLCGKRRICHKTEA